MLSFKTNNLWFSVKYLNRHLGVKSLLQQFRWPISITWFLVLIENALLVSIPLLIGLSIDGLLAGSHDQLIGLGASMVVLLAVSVVRRLYDTRVYSGIRVHLGLHTDKNNRLKDVSSRNARLDMSKELVDFLESDLPNLITAVVQIVISIIVLFVFSWQLAISAFTATLLMLLLYLLFHKRFHFLNGELNHQFEQQVSHLETGGRRPVFFHLMALRHTEVKLSDTEAWVYGGIFVFQIAFVIFNLWFASQLPEISAGKIFTIVTYSWEYVEAALLLPITLQSWSRLSEITERLND